MSFEILSAEQLEQITGKKRASAQIAWFKCTFGVEPVVRPDRSIVMTQAAFEALMLKRLGIQTDRALQPQVERPPVYPIRRKGS